jgi:hypothetical protein
MAGSIESTAVLRSRAEAVGIPAAGVQAMLDAGFTSLAKWAFACSYTPGSADDTPFQTMLATMLQGAPSPGDMSSYRRLYFEAHTLSIADLRERTTRTEDSAPRKLAAPERAARYEAQKVRLSNLQLTGELEISNMLLDEVIQMCEDDALHYVGPEKCTRKDQEVVGKKKVHGIVFDAYGGVKANVDGAQDPLADLSTDFKIRSAFQRRALAFDQAGLVSFEIMERWHTALYIHLMRKAPQGYANITMNQVLLADMELFKRLTELTRSGIRTKCNGERPLEKVWTEAVEDSSVRHLLQPLQGSSSSSHNQSPALQVIKEASKSAKPKGKAAKAAAFRDKLKTAKAKGKGKGKGSGKSMQDYASEFPGMDTKDAEGVNICFNFNKAAGCSFGEPGKRCGRGRHICMVPGCAKPHGAHEHARKTMQ